MSVLGRYVWSQSYGHYYVTNGLLFVCSTNNSNKLVTVLVNAPERSYWVLPEMLWLIGFRVLV